MQIAVVNQKTRSIPSRSFEAFGGSQGTSSATTVAAAPNTTPEPEQLEDRAPAHGDRD